MATSWKFRGNLYFIRFSIVWSELSSYDLSLHDAICMSDCHSNRLIYITSTFWNLYSWIARRDKNKDNHNIAFGPPCFLINDCTSRIITNIRKNQFAYQFEISIYLHKNLSFCNTHMHILMIFKVLKIVNLIYVRYKIMKYWMFFLLNKQWIMDYWEKNFYMYFTLSAPSTVHNSLSTIKRITP